MADKASSSAVKETVTSKTVLELLEEDDEFEVRLEKILLKENFHPCRDRVAVLLRHQKFLNRNFVSSVTSNRVSTLIF